MIKITEFQCEVCLKRYKTQHQAAACESIGRFDPNEFTPGILFPKFHHGFSGIFCAINFKEYKQNPHMGECNFLAFRPNVGDSTFETGWCGHEFLSIGEDQTRFEKFYGINQTHHRGKYCSEDDLKTPEFIRAANYLNDNGITPMYFNESFELLEYITFF